jgi:predicted ArsR family transcriptional regulator
MSETIAQAPSLVGLLGESRAAIVEHLHRSGPQPASAFAQKLGVSEVAVRRHLGVLVADGLVQEVAQRASGGRPAACFDLTDRAQRLFPQSYDRFANEVLAFLTAEHGREGLLSFLRWRVDREVDALADTVTGSTVAERVERLAAALSAAGFSADVRTDVGDQAATGDGVGIEQAPRDALAERSLPQLQLVQHHCVIEDVAREHPEICNYEAAAFSRALGTDVTLSRTTTIAAGAPACVCTVTVSPPSGDH